MRIAGPTSVSTAATTAAVGLLERARVMAVSCLPDKMSAVRLPYQYPSGVNLFDPNESDGRRFFNKLVCKHTCE